MRSTAPVRPSPRPSLNHRSSQLHRVRHPLNEKRPPTEAASQLSVSLLGHAHFHSLLHVFLAPGVDKYCNAPSPRSPPIARPTQCSSYVDAGAVRQLSKGNRNVERYRKEPAGVVQNRSPAKLPMACVAGSSVVAPRETKSPIFIDRWRAMSAWLRSLPRAPE